MMYIHDYTGVRITPSAYRELPREEQRSYHIEQVSNTASDLIQLGIEAGIAGIILGDFSSGAEEPSSFDPFTDNSSNGFDSGFGGGDYSGGGAGGDY